MSSDTETSRDRATVTEHHIEDTSYTKYPGNYYGKNDAWNVNEFKKLCHVTIQEYINGKELEIDIEGISPAIANAYRRIMIAEVPTMAIEHVFIYNNTSVIQDELLAHRLGLVPIRADPAKFEWKTEGLGPENTSQTHTLVFKLHAKCEKLPGVEPSKTGRREDLYKDYKVLSQHLVWVPLGNQASEFKNKNVIRPVHKSILLAKLSNNQEIDLKMHAIKGIGRDHAKFSPVATASYRLKPSIQLKEKISGQDAEQLKESFSKGVIELTRKGEARVANSRIDSGSRNIFRHAHLKNKVKYELIKDHYIFKIDSTGAMPALDVLLQSCDILETKCQEFLKELEMCRSRVDESTPVVESI